MNGVSILDHIERVPQRSRPKWMGSFEQEPIQEPQIEPTVALEPPPAVEPETQLGDIPWYVLEAHEAAKNRCKVPLQQPEQPAALEVENEKLRAALAEIAKRAAFAPEHDVFAIVVRQIACEVLYGE